MTALRAGVVVALMYVATSAASLAQAPTFSADVAVVRVDVSVRQNGRALRGLTAADFELVDNGVPQRVSLVGLESMPLSVVVALDLSGSVQGARLAHLQKAGQRVVDMLEPRDTSALVTFSDRALVAVDVTSDKARLTSALQRVVPGADTALVDAAHTAMVLGDADASRPVVIVFSDGVDTASFLSPAQVLDTARRTGPVVYAVTSAAAEPGGFLDDLVRLTGGRRLDAPSLDRVSDTFADILREARERYLITYSPTGVAAGGWHDVSVRVRGNGRADVRARPGYLAGP